MNLHILRCAGVTTFHGGQCFEDIIDKENEGQKKDQAKVDYNVYDCFHAEIKVSLSDRRQWRSVLP